jgi:hypothetical protein
MSQLLWSCYNLKSESYVNLKKYFLVVGVIIVSGCSHDGGSSATSGGASETTQSQPSVEPATGPLTDGTQTRMSDGSIAETCSPQVLTDYDVVLAGGINGTEEAKDRSLLT